MDLAERHAMLDDFAKYLSKVLDEAAKGQDIYCTVGTTRNKENFTWSTSIDGNRETVYNSSVVGLILGATDYLSSVIEEGQDEEELDQDKSTELPF